MGMNANVEGFGPFSKDIAECLDYPADYYDDVEEGTLVACSFFCCNTSETSRDLAEVLGCKPWDFSTHPIDLSRVNWFGLEMLNEEKAIVSSSHEIEDFKKMLNKEFKLFYMPHG